MGEVRQNVSANRRSFGLAERPALLKLRDIVGRSVWRATHVAPTHHKLAFDPAFDVEEIDDAYVFRADLPGVNPDGVEVTCTRGWLTVRGRRDAADGSHENGEWLVLERTFGVFEREFALPENADGERLIAALESGVLTVTVPKAPPRDPRRVTVKKRDPNGHS